MSARPTIVRAYTTRYSDTGQVKAYVEWSDGSRTEGEARRYDRVPIGDHMYALFQRALSLGLTIERRDV